MRSRKLLPVFVAVLTAFTAVSTAQDKKLTADEIIRKHLESIGTAEARLKTKNRFAAGLSYFASKQPVRETSGKALIVSQDADLFVLASFMSQEYPFEKIGYFNRKPSLPFITAGKRSPLGSFIADHGSLLSSGLFTGSISTTWGLEEGRRAKGRFEEAGIKKVDGRKLYALNFFPGSAGSSEFTIQLFFDADTFRHVRTEYRHVVVQQQERIGIMGVQSGVKLVVVEKFDDHKMVEGLTLPHLYSINYLTDSNSGTVEFDWRVTITNYFFNRELEPGFFTFDAEAEKKDEK